MNRVRLIILVPVSLGSAAVGTTLGIWMFSATNRVVGIGMAVLFAMLLGVIVGVAIRLQEKRRAGAVLLDFGPSKVRMALGIIPGGLIALDWVILLTTCRVVSLSAGMFGVMMGVLPILASCGFFLMGLSKSEIREGGLWLFFPAFIKWERIQSYEWGGKSGHTLLLKVRRGWGKISLRVPVEHKEAVERLLAQYIPSAGEQSGQGSR